jgi:hypothetical protein
MPPPRDRVLAFDALSQGKCIVLEGYARVRLVMRAIERVYAGTVSSQQRDHGTISVEHA